MSVIKWDQDQKQVNIVLAIVVLRVCTGHVLLVLTGFLVSTSALSFFPFESLPHFSPLFFLPSFCMTWFCMSGPWSSSSTLFSLFWVQNLCAPMSLFIVETWPNLLTLHHYVLFLTCFLCSVSHSVCSMFILDHLSQFTSFVSQDCSDTWVLFKPVKVSFFLDVNTIIISFFHHSLGLLNGLGFISIFYMVCLGVFFLKW